ncbi:hypothetical protein [Cohaesibacter celericrescens]|uniref:Uncharacterized protein n=1 Tax=Cohaesibacter celericrescens TaxID=2067669 RepID=A0A2N5XMT4_9HYPH|nr:hypothetical protein [Cohaesibacter celericrescens]PLW75856.1 hypothetical protein C0081_17285 [Cohaesibacter celericrescens]
MTDMSEGAVVTPLTSEKSDTRPKIKPIINTLTTDDLTEALSDGLRDFQKSAPYGLFFGGFYAVAGWLLLWLLTSYDLPYLVYPLASGFALIAPFIAAACMKSAAAAKRALSCHQMLFSGRCLVPEPKNCVGWPW